MSLNNVRPGALNEHDYYSISENTTESSDENTRSDIHPVDGLQVNIYRCFNLYPLFPSDFIPCLIYFSGGQFVNGAE